MPNVWIIISWQVITQGGVTYRNEPWHRECFTCTHCVKSLAGQRFTSRDDKPYCAECFGELFSKRCTACSKPITGQCLRPGSAITNGREPRSCLGRVFNCKLGSFTDNTKNVAICKWPLLKLKTQPRFCPVSWSLSMLRLNRQITVKEYTWGFTIKLFMVVINSVI
jgi:LIM domain